MAEGQVDQVPIPAVQNVHSMVNPNLRLPPELNITAASQQGMLTPPGHLIPPLACWRSNDAQLDALL